MYASRRFIATFGILGVLLFILMSMLNMRKEVKTVLIGDIMTELTLPKQDIERNLSNCAICVSKVPCSYNDEVDLRILVLTFDRVESLTKSLDALEKAEYMGDRIALEIWIDVPIKGSVNEEVLQYALAFRFKHGQTCVHVQTEHVNVAYQWIYSWQLKPGTKELGVFIEDDVDVSRYFYRYLKNASKFYARNREINGICLNDENVQIVSGPKVGQLLIQPKDKSNMVYLYGLFCTWGYAPDPEHWRKFQDWYHNNVSKDNKFDPTLSDAALQSGWYRTFTSQGRGDTMLHEMYFVRYSHDHKLYTLHPNLQVFELHPNSGLTSCRKEKGLHYFGESDKNNHRLKVWREEFVNFPQTPQKYGWDGNLL